MSYTDLSQATAYPDNNPKSVVGVTKPSFHAIPPNALIPLGQAMLDGMNKYGLMNWRGKPVAASVYYNGLLRHAFAWWDGEDEAPDSLIHHLGHLMAGAAIVLDAIAHGTFIDDRPKLKGRFPQMAAAYAERAKGLADRAAELRAAADACGAISSAGLAVSNLPDLHEQWKEQLQQFEPEQTAEPDELVQFEQKLEGEITRDSEIYRLETEIEYLDVRIAQAPHWGAALAEMHADRTAKRARLHTLRARKKVEAAQPHEPLNLTGEEMRARMRDLERVVPRYDNAQFSAAEARLRNTAMGEDDGA